MAWFGFELPPLFGARQIPAPEWAIAEYDPEDPPDVIAEVEYYGTRPIEDITHVDLYGVIYKRVDE